MRILRKLEKFWGDKGSFRFFPQHLSISHWVHPSKRKFCALDTEIFNIEGGCYAKASCVGSWNFSFTRLLHQNSKTKRSETEKTLFFKNSKVNKSKVKVKSHLADVWMLLDSFWISPKNRGISKPPVVWRSQNPVKNTSKLGGSQADS